MTIRKQMDPVVGASETGIEQVLSNEPDNFMNDACNTTTTNDIDDSDKSNNAATNRNTTASTSNDEGDIFYSAVEEEGSAQEQRKLKHWRDSPFAVGVVNPTWKEDRPKWCGNNAAKGDIDETMAVSSIVCGCLGADRVGNFAILAQSTETYQVETIDEETGQVVTRSKQRPRLLWVIGPYWTVNMFLTWPLILGVSGWVLYRRIMESHIAVIITWSIGTMLLMLSLCMISCRNPGILHRYNEPPPETEDWRWNDQAKTYRPPKARFDPETQVVVEGFDHTCPWTGTAIGSRNMFWFRVFIIMVPIMIGYSAILAVVGSTDILRLN
ncbi:DHHC palmitoyltransferase [Nitzschia inconspicua]|uniref:Palmitoyltransferase n=1 Tax=Nitzschia inconspicua TaxID=303405 RepID=A0A9K3LM17_9STRA|nr:DHHC palmitoyltransferase [Nitzschia inconspicua]